MNLDRFVNIDDFRDEARRVLPKLVFDFIEGGVEDELCLAANRSSWNAHRLVPRYLNDIGTIDQRHTIFGQAYDAPFGIAPTGLNGLFRPGADLMLAGAAAEARIPFVMSTASTATLEELTHLAGPYAWYQLYCSRDPAITADMIGRAEIAGIRTLVVTVDAPVEAKRERNIRNGFGRPGPMKPHILFDALLHPRWIWRYLRSGGMPTFGNFVPYAGAGASNAAVVRFTMTQTPNFLTWSGLEQIRRLWPHTLLVKGVIISNHGGRVLDRSASSLDVLPHVREAIGGRAKVMIDSGIRRGADIVTAYSLGADFVFVGRATLYAAVVGGLEGVRKAIEILRTEIMLALSQLGCPTMAGVSSEHLLSALRAE